MKIIRYLDAHGQSGHAALQPDGTALAITGDVFGDYRRSGRRVEVARLLAPVQPAAIVCIGLNYRAPCSIRAGRSCCPRI